MAAKSTKRPEIEELIRLSQEARVDLGSRVAGIRKSLDVPTRVFGSMRSHPKIWLFASVAAGVGTSMLLGKLPGRGKKKGSSIKKKAIALTLTAARPIVKIWLANKLKSLGSNWIEQHVNKASAVSSVSQSPFRIEPSQNPADVRTQGP
ncbi:MAG: hypothetical protein ACO3SO_05860 [Luteolibacter sp.]